MGKIAEEFSEKLWITSDNPRYEKIKDINSDITKEMVGNNFEIIKDRGTALSAAINEINSGDLLVILGKGRENFQDIKGNKFPYSDIEIIESYL